MFSGKKKVRMLFPVPTIGFPIEKFYYIIVAGSKIYAGNFIHIISRHNVALMSC